MFLIGLEFTVEGVIYNIVLSEEWNIAMKTKKELQISRKLRVGPLSEFSGDPNQISAPTLGNKLITIHFVKPKKK